MKTPRFLPIVAVAIGGVIAVNALSSVSGLPDLLTTAKAWAEEAAPKSDAEKKADEDKAAKDAKEAAAKSALPANVSLLPPAQPAPQVCAPTAAELARQAGLSPAELQVLQSLGARRNQLDQRETDMNVQIALLAAAEAKLDAKIKTLNGLKGDVQGLLGQADAQKEAEANRLVKVFETMKPKDAAARLTILSDEVRLPVGAKMKDRALSAILAQMDPRAAKDYTEKLANRMAVAEAARKALANPPPAPVAAPPAAQAAAPAAKPAAPRAAQPKRQAKAPAKRPVAKPQAVAAATPPTAPTVAKPAAPATPAAAPPKAG